MLNHCSECLDNSNHPFGLHLMHNGICNGCHDAKFNKNKFGNISNVLKKLKKGQRYDCIIPIQGTPEDYFVVKKVLEMDMFPLLFFVNNYFCNEIAWQNVHGLIETFDLELRTFNPNIKTYKKLVSYSFRKFEEIFFPYKLIKFFKTFELANEIGVNLIISGEQQAQVSVGKFKISDLVENTKWSFQEHELSGISINNLIDTGIDINPKDLTSLIPIKQFNRQISWHYLSNYMHWDQWKQDVDVIKIGAKAELTSGSFDYCYRAGNSVYYELQDLLRHKKFGYYKLKDHLSREIRHGRIIKGDAQTLYEIHEIKRSFHVDDFFKWLGVNEDGIDWIKYNLFKEYNFTSQKDKVCFKWDDYFSQIFKTDAKRGKKSHLLMDKGVK